MSLIHWWPLNGNTTDYGLNPISLINNGAIIDNNGKIGKCYSFDGSNDYLSATITVTSEMSFTCWLKFNAGGNYHILDCRSTASGNPGYQPLYAGVDYGLQFYTSNSGSLNVSASDCGFTTGVWYHLALTISNNGIKAYINGNLVGSNSNTGYNFGSQTLKVGTRCTNQNWFNGLLNDLRVYDHALSAKEVKEISKGLIMHYTFEDPYAEGTTNLISRLSQSNERILINDGVAAVQTISGDGHFSIVLNQGLTSGTTYTLSFYVTNMGENDVCSFGFYDAGMHNTTAIHNGLNSITFTAWKDIPSSLTFDDSGRSNSNIIYMKNFQLEQKDHATPFVKDIREPGLIYDNSGYGYNGTVNGDIQIVPNSASGEYSATFDGSTSYVLSSSGPYLNGASECTFSIWCCPTNTSVLGLFSLEYNTNWRLSASTIPNTVRLRDNSGDSTYKELSMGSYTANEWALFTLTYKNGTATTYKNGVQIGTIAIGGTALNTNQNFLGFGKNNQSSSYYNGKVGDIKIYSTALSTEDILLEYNRKASIDKNGNLFSGEFVETASLSNPKIDKNNLVSASSISEGLLTKVLDDGSIFERIYYFDYDVAGSVFSTSEAKLCNEDGKFSILGQLNNYIPNDGWYEFYYREKDQWVRWKQSYNPLSRYTSGNSGTASEYSYIGGSATPHSSFYGLTRYSAEDNNACYLRGAPSWWCAIAPYGTDYDVFPDMWGNSTNNHHQELWVRIDNMKKGYEFNNINKFKMTSRGITANQIIED